MCLDHGGRPERLRFGILPNEDMRKYLFMVPDRTPVAIEMIAAMGMAVGAEVFETCLWIGRFIELLGPARVTLIKRHEVKMHLCANSRAKDANIRQALIDRFGPGSERAI